MALPPLALTMGEPAGIGGEIALAAWRRLAGQGPVFLALDDPQRLRRIGTAPVREIADAAEAPSVFAHALPVLPLGQRVVVEPGRPDPAQAAAVVQSIVRAVSLTRAGATAGVVTNPIHKATLYAAGFGFPGHTEFLAELAGDGSRPVMMLAGPGLRVVPLTVHIALSEVPRRLDEESIVAQARIVADALRRDFGIAAPRLAVAALNPHAGEEGAMGDEEGRIIGPALRRLRAEGIDVAGPLPADTMFHARARAAYDAALCMYHDQALVPVKTLHFDDAVNVTLGLPFVRTSPDHGTALNIAGQGTTRPDSLIAAIELAAAMARRRRDHLP